METAKGLLSFLSDYSLLFGQPKEFNQFNDQWKMKNDCIFSIFNVFHLWLENKIESLLSCFSLFIISVNICQFLPGFFLFQCLYPLKRKTLDPIQIRTEFKKKTLNQKQNGKKINLKLKKKIICPRNTSTENLFSNCH